jgi:hypothetical protein
MLVPAIAVTILITTLTVAEAGPVNALPGPCIVVVILAIDMPRSKQFIIACCLIIAAVIAVDPLKLLVESPAVLLAIIIVVIEIPAKAVIEAGRQCQIERRISMLHFLRGT